MPLTRRQHALLHPEDDSPLLQLNEKTNQKRSSISATILPASVNMIHEKQPTVDSHAESEPELEPMSEARAIVQRHTRMAKKHHSSQLLHHATYADEGFGITITKQRARDWRTRMTHQMRVAFHRIHMITLWLVMEREEAVFYTILLLLIVVSSLYYWWKIIEWGMTFF